MDKLRTKQIYEYLKQREMCSFAELIPTLPLP